MYSKSLIALAAVGAVSASPVLNVRQASSVASSAASAASSAASSAVASVTSGASSAAGSATSAVSSAVGTASSAASSAVSSGTASSSAAASSASAGAETFPAYPCPAGTLLTYAEANQTFPVSITQLTQAAGEFATSPIFPNITASEGGNTVGATHTFNLMGLNVSEVLVNVTTNSTSGSAIWNWNNTAPITISGINGIEGLQLANYSTVLQLYDPDFTTTGTIGNSSIAVTFTNACFSNQEQGAAVLGLLAGLELGNLGAAVQGNSTSGGSSSSAMPSMMSSSMASMASSSAASGASSATSAAASGASSGTSAAASGAASATSAVASAASGAASAAASAVSSAA